MFSDLDVGEKSAGLYQYRIEVTFHDGTYEYLNSILKNMVGARVILEEYHNIATSYYVSESSEPNSNYIGWRGRGDYIKQTRKPYYQDGVFSQAFTNFINSHPKSAIRNFWKMSGNFGVYDEKNLVSLLSQVGVIFSLHNSWKSDFVQNIYNMMSPGSGSPQGINFVMKFVDSVITKLEDLLDVTKISKKGSELSNSSVPDGYSFNNFFDYHVSPTDTILYDDHVFYDLFEGLSNENIFSDYLTVGDDHVSDGAFSDFGLRRVYFEKFTRRCQLESLKYLAGGGAAFGAGGWNPIERWDDHIVGGAGVESEFYFKLSETGYSYLSPSIIELSDPSSENTLKLIDAFGHGGPGYGILNTTRNSFSYYYNAFKKEENTIGLSDSYGNLKNYEKLLLALMNYKFNKDNTQDADLSDAFSFTSGTPSMTYGPGVDPENIEIRESYKNIFEGHGLTVHDVKNYETFYGPEFDKTPGTVGSDNKSDKEEYHTNVGNKYPGLWLKEDYSDGNLLTQTFFRSLLFHPKQDFINKPQPLSPSSIITNGDYNNPYNGYRLYNDYKNNSAYISSLWKNAYSWWEMSPSLGSTTGQSMGENSQAMLTEYNAFIYVNLALVAKVEVFHKPSGQGSTLPVAKDDESNWVILEKAHITNLSADENLFCRLVIADSRINKSIKLPVLDKYFIISGKELPVSEEPQYDLELPTPYRPEEFTTGWEDWEEGVHPQGALFLK